MRDADFCGAKRRCGSMPKRFATRCLAVSGELNRANGRPELPRHPGEHGRRQRASISPPTFSTPTTNRRTVYRTTARTAPALLLETLDCADPAVATPRRSVTTTPLQALSLLNNAFMRKSAAAFANRVQAGGRRSSRQADRACVSVGLRTRRHRAGAGIGHAVCGREWPGRTLPGDLQQQRVPLRGLSRTP